jgi:hypothetical protein
MGDRLEVAQTSTTRWRRKGSAPLSPLAFDEQFAAFPGAPFAPRSGREGGLAKRPDECFAFA